MKKLLLLALFAAITRLHADDPATAPPASPKAEEVAAPASPDPADLADKPAEPAAPAAASVAGPGRETASETAVPAGLSFEPASETPPPAETTAEPAAASELRFSDRLLADPEADLTTPRVATNLLRVQGIGARIVRPSKFGSFFQLFNPLAPVEEGMESQPVYWYDGQLNTAARPRGLRDDRTETPVGGVVVSVGK